MNSVSTQAAPAAIGPYSQAIVVGSMVYTSGQIPVDPTNQEVVNGGIAEQAEQVFKNLSAVLNAAGTNLGNTVKTTCFLADMADFPVFNSIYEKFFPNKPARSCVAVKSLPKGVLVEVETIAVI